MFSKPQIRPYRDEDKKAVIELWQKAGLTRSWNSPEQDIVRKLKVQSQWFLVAEHNQQIIASAMAGYDGHRGWINYLAVDPSMQGQGIGRKLMEHAEQLLQEYGCPKINLQIRKGNQGVIDFYEKIGYSEDEVVSFGKRLIPD